MNSRDAAYEEQVKAALEASKMDSTISEVAVEDEPEAMSEARDNEVEDIGEAAPIRKPKRKREDDDDCESHLCAGEADGSIGCYWHIQ